MKNNCIIFCLDDDQDTLDLVKETFDAAGIDNCCMFNNKEEFLEKFDRHVHIAVVDHYLNGQSVGFEIMDQIFKMNESLATLSPCKVIIISGQQDPKMIANYLNKHAYRYIDKNDKKFFSLIVQYVKEAISEISAFYHSVERLKFGMDNINSIIDFNKG